MSLARINVKFTADLKQFSTEMQTAVREVQKQGKKLQDIGKNLSIGITAPFTALSGLSVVNFDAQAKAIAQVETGLQSTGNAAGKTSEELQKLASQLQNNSLFGDETILKDVTAQLLTFTQITGQEFDRAQQAVLDLATRLDGDLKGAAIQVGKALNDPVKGVTALSKAGVQFSEEQKKTIKALVDTNNTAAAQRLILKELEKQYGGSAAAAAKVGTGPLQQLKNQLGDITEEFGAMIVNGIAPAVRRLSELAKSFAALSPETKKFIFIVSGIAAAVGPVLLTLGTLMRTFPVLIANIKLATSSLAALSAFAATNPFVLIGLAVGALVGAFALLTNKTREYVKEQSAVQNITEKVNKNLDDERAKINQLLSVARDEKRTREDRLKAIRELNKISPEYLGNLRLEKINTEETTAQIEKYIDALKKKYRAQAAEEEIKRITKELFEIEKSRLKLATAREEAQKKLNQAGENNVAAITAVNAQLEKGNILFDARERFLLNELESIEKLINGYGVLDDELVKTGESAKRIKVEPIKLDVKGTRNTIAELEEQIDKLREFQRTVSTTAETWKLAQAEIEKLEIAIKIKEEGFTSLLKIGEELKATVSRADITAKAVEDMNKRISESFSQVLSNAAAEFVSGMAELIGQLASGAANFGQVGKFILTSIADLIVQLGKSAIQIGTAMLAVKAAFKNPFGAIAAGSALVIFGTLLKSTLPKDFQRFQNGGIVGGSSQFGDKILARVNSGELILNQRQQKKLWQQLENNGLAMAVDISVDDIVLDGDKIRIALARNAKKITRR
jgi:uncharacterized membrane-anchored protein YhcB (DUF1043 family)